MSLKRLPCQLLWFSFYLLGISCMNAQEKNSSDSISVLNLLFIGDVMGHGPQIKSAEVIKDEKYNYEPCFRYIQPIIEQADFAIGNLEVTLPGEPPYQGYPKFRSPNELAEALKKAGFDMMVTANNHSNDAGGLGVTNTINTLKRYGFFHTGTFRNEAERAIFYPLIVYKNDFKLAFLNYTYDTNGWATEAPTMVNEIDTNLIKADMETARLLKPDAIIVLMHWGKEYKLVENKKQQRLTNLLFQEGADLVIGSHPHVVQPIKESIYQGDNEIERKVLVTYSLGNFISNQTKLNTDGGLLFEIALLKDQQTGAVTLGPHHYIPLWRYIHRDKKGKATFHTIPISAFEDDKTNLLEMKENDKTAMNAFSETLRTHLSNYDSSERKISLEALNLSPIISKK